MFKTTFDKSVVKIPSILDYLKRFYEAKCVLGSAIFSMENVSIAMLHIISHNFCIEEDICL